MKQIINRGSFGLIFLLSIFCCLLLVPRVIATSTLVKPLDTNKATKEVKIAGVIYPTRFNAARGEEARYHLLVWEGGVSANALIETPVDDLEFHEALVALGAHPGDNLTMGSWHKRHDPDHPAPKEKVAGSPLGIRIAWQSHPTGVSIERAFRQREAENQLGTPSGAFRFGGNRDRWFNHIPLAPRPGCLACLYSCPSGKVSQSALSVHDYVATPSRFEANTDILPPDGTPVTVTFHLVQ